MRNRLLAPLTAALIGTAVQGFVMLPAPAQAAPGVPATTGAHARHAHQKVGAIGDGTQRRPNEPSAVFRRSSYLCMGYQSCREAGMGNAGYASNNSKMYWRMYSGHNCTNYAAYRMVRSGLPNERPWSGGGNAMYWGTSMPRITDGTPRIGAVAWWKANTGPAGSVGHVAYVEKVVSADQIVVSQDSWGGDFSWAVITRASGNWPSGFVHFNDKPLTNTAPPTVSGTPKVGSVLSATAGSWKPSTVKTAYQWYADGRAIQGAEDDTLTVTRALVDEQVTVGVTASQLGYPTKTATSAPTAAVQPGALRNTDPPAISGEPQVDSSLKVSAGTWNPAPDRRAYQWYADGEPVPGATSSTLTLGPDLVDRTISAKVTAIRTGYRRVSARTAPTTAVAPGTFTVSAGPSFTGDPELGSTLTLDPGVFSPAGADVGIQWLRNGEPVLNATGPTYQITGADLGHRVYAQVTLSRPGYLPSTLGSRRTPLLRSAPHMKVVTEHGAHRLRLAVTVMAPGVTDVEGPLVVRMAGISQEVTVRDSVATVVLKGLPQGRDTMTLRFGGSQTVKRLVTTRTVRVG